MEMQDLPSKEPVMEVIVLDEPCNPIMTTTTSTTSGLSSRKRSFDEAEDNVRATPTKRSRDGLGKAMSPGLIPTPPLTFGSSNGSPAPASGEPARAASPTPSITSSLTSVTSGTQQINGNGIHSSSTKRRKLTFAEREQKKQEKEAKEKERAEQKAKREEEKKARDEERRKRNEEKEVKKREKDLEKLQKEEEKRKLEEDKSKKERAQMRINAFFAKPKKVESTSGNVSVANDSRHRSNSVESGNNGTGSASCSPLPQKPLTSDFDRDFLPFALQSHTRLALYLSHRRMGREADSGALDRVLARGEDCSAEIIDASTAGSFIKMCSQRRGRPRRRQPRVKDIISYIQGSCNNPIDLTDMSFAASLLQPTDYLQTVTMKHLQFAEDVRPPYTGTFTKTPPDDNSLKLSRNPFRRHLPSINYDYDSEAEWEEPGEGEDLDSECEKDADSVDGENDMDGFLDDEDTETAASKQGHSTGDIQPRCTGLVWEDSQGKIVRSEYGASYNVKEMTTYRMEVILDIQRTPIDPSSTTYWQISEAASTSMTSAARLGLPPIPDSGLMQPPRLPLQARPNTSVTAGTLDLVDGDGRAVKPQSSTFVPPKPPKPIQILEGADLAEFKRAVEGSGHKKAQLLEVLKARFPRTSQKVIKDTLGSVAARVGLKEEDKKWAVIK